MRVLVIENFGGTGLGQVGRALDEVSAEIDYLRLQAGDVLPGDSSAYDAMVVLGGGQNALDDEGSPWFPALMDLIRDFERRDRAVLGVCLGAQLLARTFGGENHVGGHREFGWHSIELKGEAAGDPVFAALPTAFPIFQWHDDSFSLPPEAVGLASSKAIENQAFRIGRAVYGTQFHFEADTPLVEEWSATFANWLAEREPDWVERHPEQARLYGPAANAIGLALARAWVAAI
ncbi:MAG: type 1 glutamine amidotransferase [Rhizobiaceae bacterium]